MALSDKAQELLELYPAFFRSDPDIRGTLDAHSIELESLDETVEQLMVNGNPATADILVPAWESLLGISPDESAGVRTAGTRTRSLLSENTTVATTRQSRLTKYMRRLASSGSGAVWESRVTDILGPAWSYVTYSADNIRGLWWDYPYEASQWTGDTNLVQTSESKAILTAPSGLIFRRGYNLPDSELVVKFQLSTLGSITLIGKYVDEDNFVAATVSADTLSIFTNVSGTTTERDAQSISIDRNTTYYLKLQVVDDVITATTWIDDPNKPSSTPDDTSTHTLTSGDATALQAPVTGQVGLAWTGQNEVYWTKGALANVVVPENTIRIFFPFEATTPELVDLQEKDKIAIREITPANTDLEYDEGTGFVLGVSELGSQGF